MTKRERKLARIARWWRNKYMAATSSGYCLDASHKPVRATGFIPRNLKTVRAKAIESPRSPPPAP